MHESDSHLSIIMENSKVFVNSLSLNFNGQTTCFWLVWNTQMPDLTKCLASRVLCILFGSYAKVHNQIKAVVTSQLGIKVLYKSPGLVCIFTVDPFL